MDTCGDSLSDPANRRVRILGWLTIAIAAAPQVAILGLMISIALSPRSGAGGPIGSSSFDLGICCYLAVVAAPWTLGLCLTAWALFRHRPWARALTLVLTVVVFVLTLLFGGGGSLYLHNDLAAQRGDHVFEYQEFDPVAEKIVERRIQQIVEPEPHVRRSYAQMQALSFLPFLVCSPYCVLAQIWLWRKPVRVLFSVEARSIRRNQGPPTSN
jgi:hypothetical protein